MKKYIFLTADIHPVGGMQTYVAGKSRYLKANGWNTFAFYYGDKGGECAYPELNQYTYGGLIELSRQPYEWTYFIRQVAIKEMIGVINRKDDDTIVVESQTDITAIWGELLASHIGAKHVCLICNEKFVGHNKHYRENLEFFDFKHKRRELAGINAISLPMLFGDYKILEDDECYVFDAAADNPVQDINNDSVNRLERAEYNICYIGRAKKTYVPMIFEDVASFAKKNGKKSIQFILVGDMEERRKCIDDIFSNIDNIQITELGDLVPIPKALFDKVDVVIAGAGCANLSYKAKAITIVADAETYLANGVLGYNTFNDHFADDYSSQTTYYDLLEQILVNRIINRSDINFLEIRDPEVAYKENMDFIELSNKEQDYYLKPGNVVKISCLDSARFYIRKYLPSLYRYHQLQKEKRRK